MNIASIKNKANDLFYILGIPVGLIWTGIDIVNNGFSLTNIVGCIIFVPFGYFYVEYFLMRQRIKKLNKLSDEAVNNLRNILVENKLESELAIHDKIERELKSKANHSG